MSDTKNAAPQPGNGGSAINAGSGNGADRKPDLPPPAAAAVDVDARWLEIQRISDAIANKDGAPTELESALCGAVWRAREWKALQSEIAAWIPVGERLPHPHSDNDYIVATRSGYVCALNFGEQGWYGLDGEESGRDGYWNGCVTHWQELPSAPPENKATTL